MLIGLFTDIHTTPDFDRSQQVNGTLELMHDYFMQNNIQTVINLGDFFDSQKITSYNEIRTFNHYITLFSYVFMNYVVIGNHEILEIKDLSSSVWGLIQSLGNQRWEILNQFWRSIQFDNLDIGFLPYGISQDELKKVPWKIQDPTEKMDILFHHQDVVGMFYPSGKLIELSDNAINLTQNFAKFYIGGHIHVHQETEYNNAKSVYLGSVLHKSYDYIENFNLGKLASFYVLDTKTMKLTQIYNPLSHVNLKYTDKSDVQKIYSDLTSIYGVNPDYKVKIRFVYEGKEYDCFEVDKAVRKLFPEKKVELDFVRKVIKPLKSQVVASNEEAKVGQNLEEKIVNFLDSKDTELKKIYEKVKK